MHTGRGTQHTQAGAHTALQAGARSAHLPLKQGNAGDVDDVSAIPCAGGLCNDQLLQVKIFEGSGACTTCPDW